MEESVIQLLELNDPRFVMKELNALVIRAARRCAYDLGHASGEIKDPEIQKLFWDRHHMWLNVFNPTDGGKDYRDDLHRKISFLENRVEKLVALLDLNNINHDEITGSDLPF